MTERIEAYLAYLRSARGVSPRTLEAYARTWAATRRIAWSGIRA
jgi:site-specific recombinase XerC